MQIPELRSVSPMMWLKKRDGIDVGSAEIDFNRAEVDVALLNNRTSIDRKRA